MGPLCAEGFQTQERGREEGSPSGSGPCAWMGLFSTSIWGSCMNPWVWVHPGLVSEKMLPSGVGGEGKHLPPGSRPALTPGGLRSERGPGSPAQSCGLFPILLDSVSSGDQGSARWFRG